jgi:hypothetical protein
MPELTREKETMGDLPEEFGTIFVSKSIPEKIAAAHCYF